ncbi:Metacaspase type II [Mycena kentingensis (nom. inval.)]|nr:Metacaspase type II [Mycena kentingensis (nom. inval.)]
MPLRACLHHHRARRAPPNLIPPSNPTMHSAAPAVLPKPARLGSKRVLLIGIGKSVGAAYPELKAAHEDVRKMRELLLDCYSYRPEQIVVLVDDGVSGRRQPTRANILNAIAKLVKGVVAGDQLCFYYSGHSTQIESPETPNRLPTEEDRLDECLVPLGDVVSLASCRDSQQAWETPEGETMTGCLVAYLRRARLRRGRRREPTLGEVLRAVSLATARLGTERRARANTYLARTRAWLGALRQHIGRTERKRGGRAGTARGVWVEKRREMAGYEAVQNPEMRSARPLDMGRVWTM